MNNPFEVLGLKGWADQDEIRTAYRTLVKQCHPDMIQDPHLKEEAQARMVALNLAYEEALRLAAPRQRAAYTQEIPREDAVLLAERMLQKDRPENALRQLLRAETRDAVWYYTQGKILMRMEQYHSAHQSFREAVRRDPENNTYRSGALDAAVAEKKAKTLAGKMQKLISNLKK
jgi:curved DNA-binding protein CbpA